MLRLASDADVNGRVIRGLRRASPNLDLVEAQEAGLGTAIDPAVLEWAAGEGRVLITNDRDTMIGYYRRRVSAGVAAPGLTVLRKRATIGQAIEDILIIDGVHDEGQLEGQEIYIPLC